MPHEYFQKMSKLQTLSLSLHLSVVIQTLMHVPVRHVTSGDLLLRGNHSVTLCFCCWPTGSDPEETHSSRKSILKAEETTISVDAM